MVNWLRAWPKWESWQRWILSAELIILLWQAPFARQPPNCEQKENVCSSFRDPASLFYYPLGLYLDWVDRHHDVVIALGGSAVAFFTFTLWRSTTRLWKESEAQRADNAINIARDSRAYISVEPGGIHQFTGRSTTAVGHIFIRNAGRVPAQEVRVSAALAWRKTEADHWAGVVVDQDGIQVDTVEIGAIQPGVAVTHGSNTDNVSQRQGFIYVWGRVTYKDGFSATKRETVYCHRYACEVQRLDLSNTLIIGIDAREGRYQDGANHST